VGLIIPVRVLEYLRLAWRYREDPWYVKFLAGKTVLDVGSGNGLFVSKDPARFVGIDVNEALVERCRQRELNVRCMSALKLDFPDNTFDAVHASQFIEHLAPSDAAAFLAESARVLKRGGVIFITTPGVKNVWGTFSHVRPYPPSAFEKLLSKSVENYLDGRRLELVMEGYWGARRYYPGKLRRVIGQLIDLLWPPGDPIGWTIVLKKI
jgi:SAM-dependent methyltransferase